jgi:hypothetical protein
LTVKSQIDSVAAWKEEYMHTIPLRRRVVGVVLCFTLLIGAGLAFAVSEVFADPAPQSLKDKWFHSEKVVDHHEYFTSATAERDWTNIESFEQRLEQIQIPSSKLASMSTAGLAETVLDYPFQGTFWAYDTPAMAIRAVSGQFNGIPDLVSRKNGGIVLLAIYKAANAEDIISKDDSPMITFTTLQYMLTDEKILDGLGSAGKRDLIKTALTHYHEIATNPKILEHIPVDATVWLVARAAAVEFPEVVQLAKTHPILAEYIATGLLVLENEEIGVIEKSLNEILRKYGHEELIQAP